MDNNINKISTSLLPMEDIGEELSWRELITAKDTKEVGGVPSERIAESAEGQPRGTVANSINLGGRPPEHYLTVEEGGEISKNYDQIRSNYSDEIRSMRDELYQLKAELSKRGLVLNRNSYSGYQEAFKVSDPIHEIEPLGDATFELEDIIGGICESMTIADNEKFQETLDQIEVGDYIGIFTENGPISKYKVIKVSGKDEINKRIVFENHFGGFIVGEEVKIYKSVGVVNRGSFAFTSEPKTEASLYEHSDSLKDIYLRSYKDIKETNSGFGYTFEINEEMLFDGPHRPDDSESIHEGYLTKLKVKVGKQGDPGDLVVHVIYEDDIDEFKNPIDSEELILATAQVDPSSIGSEDGKIGLAIFNFIDKETGAYPIIELKKVDAKSGSNINYDRFCIILSSTESDNENFYRVRFSNNSRKENKVYQYKEVELGEENSLILDDNMSETDLYYAVYTRGIGEKESQIYSEGLYTKKLKLDYPIEVSRARLTLRINREGYYLASQGANEYRVDVSHETELANSNYDGLINVLPGIGREDVVIGNSIRRNGANDVGSDFLLDGPIYLKESKDFYRVGYKIYLKAKNKDNSIRVELPLKAVMSDRVKYNDKISDRLIFERDLNYDDQGNEILEDEHGEAIITKYFDEFQLQIVWEKGPVDINKDFREDFVGRIHDLNLTFDKSIY